jgi:hypothetical protein
MLTINIHKREINSSKLEVAKLFRTLSAKNNVMLATDKWSPMRLDKGLQVGSKGGHGLIKYFVTDYQPDNSITFRFDLKGFDGFHKFEISEMASNKTQLVHAIEMTTSGLATMKWVLAVRHLHDAYIEDAFNKVENHFAIIKKTSEWTVWVWLLRKIMKPKKTAD